MQQLEFLLHSLNGVVVEGAGNREAVELLHGGDGRGDGLGGAEGVGPQISRRQVAVLLKPRLQGKAKKVDKLFKGPFYGK